MIKTTIHLIRDNGWVVLRCADYPNQDISIHKDKIHQNPKKGEEVFVERIDTVNKKFGDFKSSRTG